ncbi:MAG: peptidoglycan-binding domain-containing protein [Candidatus Gracilibacteria bacterium]
MIKYYKNLINFTSNFANPENTQTLDNEDLGTIKQELIKLVNDVNNYDGVNNIPDWKQRKSNFIRDPKTSLKDLQDFHRLLKTDLNNGILRINEETKNEILLLKEEKRKIKKITSTTNSPSLSPEPSTTTKSTSIPSINFDFEKPGSKWVKEALDSYFNNINNPKKQEILSVLEEFKNTQNGFKGMEKGTSAKVIFAIQIALNQLLIPVTVDGLLGPNTKKAIAQFQKEQMGFNRTNGNPGPKTMKALIKKLEAIK